MTEILKKYLLSSVAFAAEDEGGAGDTPDDSLEVDLEDDEGTTDPADEPEDEGEDEEGADEIAAGTGGAEPPSRGDRRIQSLIDRNKQIAEENARITRQLDEMRRAPAQTYQPPAETPQQRADRLALLSPEDRLRTEMDERLQVHQMQQQHLMRQLQDSSDRSAFEALAGRNPLANKMRDQVERALADVRAKGQDLPREAVFTFLVGQKAIAQMGKPNKKAAANRQRQAARPASTRSDVRGESSRRGGGAADEIERKFGDVLI